MDFIQREYDMMSECNAHEYVRDCVKNTKVPGKFRHDVSKLGIVMDSDPRYLSYRETGVPVTLPGGWILKRNENVLEIWAQTVGNAFDFKTSKLVMSLKAEDRNGLPHGLKFKDMIVFSFL